MKVELRKNGGPKITADREGLHALRELLGAALEVGHGFQSDGTLPEVVVVDDRGKVMLPVRPEKQLTERDFEKVMFDDQEKRLAERAAEDERFKRVQAALDRDTNLKRLYGGTDPTSRHKEPAEPGIEAERLDSGQE
jgi:hypothetical protein